MRSSFATMGRAFAAALVLAFAAAPASASSLKGWRDGPVSDLLTADEYRRFGALRTDAARRTFIEGFWREVESAAGSSPDAYRETFERRCKAADDRFRTGGQPGSRTDRGRVFLAPRGTLVRPDFPFDRADAARFLLDQRGFAER